MKVRWRPAVAVTLAYLCGVGITALWTRFNISGWAQIPTGAIALWLLFMLAED